MPVKLLVSLSNLLPAAAKRALRRQLRMALEMLLRVRSRPLLFTEGLVLVISPHQDDGTLGCAGTILTHRRRGAPVLSLYLTDGAGSHRGHPRLMPAEIAAIRRAEALVAEGRLGVEATQVTFLDLPDGRLSTLAPDERANAVERLIAFFNLHRPATVMLPCHRDGSDEHEAAFRLVQEALRRAKHPTRVLEYPVWARWSPLRLVHPLARARVVYRHAFPGEGPAKTRALAAYTSQLLPTAPWTEPVLPADFAVAFSSEIEFFFEA